MQTLLQARKQNGMTLTALSEISDITIANLSLIENNLSKPNKQTRQRLEEILGKLDFSDCEKYKRRTGTRKETEQVLNTFISCVISLNDIDRKAIVSKALNQLKNFR